MTVARCAPGLVARSPGAAPEAGQHGAGHRRPQASTACVLTVRRVNGVLSGLRWCFNLLALNLVVVMASLPVVTLPLALNAATVSVSRWRDDREDRAVREFLLTLRARSPWKVTIAIGGPLFGATLALEEVHFFDRGGTPMDWLCLGSGAAALTLTLSSLGYALVLSARRPDLGVLELWLAATRLSVQNALLTGPAVVGVTAVATLAGLADPATCLIGLPVGSLMIIRAISLWGARRAGAV